MKAKFLLTAAASLAVASAVHATTWEVNPAPAPANLNWSNPDNWTTTVPSAGDTASFELAVLGRRAPNLDSDREVLGVSFTTGADPFTLGSSGNHTLSVGTGGISVGSANQTINHGITSTGTAAGTFITLGNPNTSTLTLSGPLNLSSYGANNVSLSMQAGTTMVISGALTTGTGQVVQTASTGTVRITSSGNTIAADRYQINTGTLEIGGGGTGQLGGKRVIFGAAFGSATLREVLLVDADTVFNSEVRMFEPANATTVHRVGGNITSGSATFSGNIGLRDANTSVGIQLSEFTSAAGGTIIFSGEVKNDGGSGTQIGGVSKVGAGTVRFSRSAGNTYTEGTIVTAGTLEVTNSTNSGTGTGAVTVDGGTLLNNGRIAGTGTTVNAGGTISGTGTFTTPITLNVGGQIAPGNSIGTLNGQNLTWNTNDLAAGMAFELSNTDNTSDRFALTGAFTMGAGSTFIFDFQNTGFYDNVTATTYTLVTFDSTTFTDANSFDYVNLGGGLVGDFVLNSNNLQFVVVPEPSSLALLMGGVFVIVMLRRRRRLQSE